MFRLFAIAKRFTGFPRWCIGFTILYTLIVLHSLFYIPGLNYSPKDIYDLEQVTYNNTNSNTKTISCDDPVHFMYPYYHKHLIGTARRIQKNLILSYGFKNASCSNFTGFYDDLSLCATYNTTLYSKEFCTGGQIIRSPHRLIAVQLSKVMINKILIHYCNQLHKMNDVCNFKLLTFNMDNLEQRIEFITKHIDCTNNNSQPNNTWLFKECKHQGDGIHFMNNHQLIYSLIGPDKIEEKQYYNKCTNISTSQIVQTPQYFKKEGFSYTKRNDDTGGYKVQNNGLTMQEFIWNPLLIENRAFHIRTLLLIASNINPLIILHWPQWLIFRNPLEYDNTELDPLKLKSNAHIADMSDGYYTAPFGRAWGYYRFQKYLTEEYNDTNLENKMQNDMKNIITTIFKARSYYNRRNKLLGFMNVYKSFNNLLSWDIACMDTVVNNKFEIKFLEINFYCAFYCYGINGNGVDGAWKVVDRVEDDNEFCSAFANETSDILMEIYSKQKNEIDIKNINSLNKFEMVYLDK